MNNLRLRALSLLLCLALVLPMLPIPASGALDTTISIESVEEFLAIMDDPEGSYRLDANLDLGNVLPLGVTPPPDRSTLRAAIGAPGEGGLVWGESVTLDPDGTADLMFDVCASGDNVAVVWRDLNTTFGDGQDIDTEMAAAAVELNRMLLDCSGEIPVPGEITPLSTGGDVYETMPRTFCSGSAVKTAWITSTVNDPLYAGPEEYTLWLHDGTTVSAVTTTDSPITAMAFAGNELLWTVKAQETNSLWRSDSSGSITCELSDGVRNLQSNGRSFCYTEGTALISGSGSFADRRTVAAAADYERDLRLDSLGNVRFGQAGLDHSLICQLDTGETTPVFLHEDFLSGWDMDGAYLAALVKTGLDEDDTAQLVFTQTGFPEKVSLGPIRVSDPVAAPGSDVRLQLSIYNEAGALWDLNTSVTAADGTVLYQAIDSSGLWAARNPPGRITPLWMFRKTLSTTSLCCGPWRTASPPA